MNPIFKKLQFKSADKILVINSPKEFKSNLEDISRSTKIDIRISENKKYNFALIFVKSCAEISKHVKLMEYLTEDAVLWFAYPKKSSKKIYI